MKIKKSIGIIFMLVVVIGICASLMAYAETSILPGDFNGDGIVNGKDVTRLRKYINSHNAEGETQGIEIFEEADVDKNGILDAQDLEILKVSLAFYNEDTDDSVIKYGFKIIDGHFYFFGEDGRIRKNITENGYRFGSDGKLIGNNIFVTINNNTYYMINNKVVKNYYIINGNIYNFGDDGAMKKDCEHDGHRFGPDGKLEGTDIFITINNNTYYMVNNVIVKNYYVINGNIYNFGDDGAMKKDCEHDGHRFG
ncbi:MAG: dockerin type I domain-containing protein, partial [Clostridia bacterium]|nr:dockerin type I domain-containing protein [Clostridia bacterium]